MYAGYTGIQGVAPMDKDSENVGNEKTSHLLNDKKVQKRLFSYEHGLVNNFAISAYVMFGETTFLLELLCCLLIINTAAQSSKDFLAMHLQ